MYARWGTFAVGLGLVLAPLVLGYGAVAPILLHVAVGLLVCIATLAAFEWPMVRFALALPALGLVWSARTNGDRSAAVVELASGVLLALLSLFPSARLVPPVERAATTRAEGRADARA
jgi:hypothetical protein